MPPAGRYRSQAQEPKWACKAGAVALGDLVASKTAFALAPLPTSLATYIGCHCLSLLFLVGFLRILGRVFKCYNQRTMAAMVSIAR